MKIQNYLFITSMFLMVQCRAPSPSPTEYEAELVWDERLDKGETGTELYKDQNITVSDRSELRVSNVELSQSNLESVRYTATLGDAELSLNYFDESFNFAGADKNSIGKYLGGVDKLII